MVLWRGSGPVSLGHHEAVGLDLDLAAQVALVEAHVVAGHDVARVGVGEEEGDDEDEEPVKDEDVGLAGLELVAVAQGELAEAEAGAGEDEDAAGVEGPDEADPGRRHDGGLRGGVAADAEVEEDGGEDEEGEEDDLDAEAEQDDVVGAVKVVGDLGLAEHSTAWGGGIKVRTETSFSYMMRGGVKINRRTGTLGEDGENITQDKDLGQPGHADEG